MQRILARSPVGGLVRENHKQRRREHRHATYIERRSESDDEVRQNVPPETWALWERVKRGIKGSPKKSRTEAFLQYMEENPMEVLEILDSKADKLVRELEEKEREALKKLKANPKLAAAVMDAASFEAPREERYVDDGIPF